MAAERAGIRAAVFVHGTLEANRDLQMRIHGRPEERAVTPFALAVTHDLRHRLIGLDD